MVKIIADTLSSISVEEAKQLGLYYLPQIVIFGDQSFRDDTEITPETFLERFRNPPFPFQRLQRLIRISYQPILNDQQNPKTKY